MSICEYLSAVAAWADGRNAPVAAGALRPPHDEQKVSRTQTPTGRARADSLSLGGYWRVAKTSPLITVSPVDKSAGPECDSFRQPVAAHFGPSARTPHHRCSWEYKRRAIDPQKRVASWIIITPEGERDTSGCAHKKAFLWCVLFIFLPRWQPRTRACTRASSPKAHYGPSLDYACTLASPKTLLLPHEKKNTTLDPISQFIDKIMEPPRKSQMRLSYLKIKKRSWKFSVPVLTGLNCIYRGIFLRMVNSLNGKLKFWNSTFKYLFSL